MLSDKCGFYLFLVKLASQIVATQPFTPPGRAAWPLVPNEPHTSQQSSFFRKRDDGLLDPGNGSSVPSGNRTALEENVHLSFLLQQANNVTMRIPPPYTLPEDENELDINILFRVGNADLLAESARKYPNNQVPIRIDGFDELLA